MIVKILHWLGIAACVALITSCFLPWTFHADINQTFTGFYSYLNKYGRPGKFLLFFALIALVLMLLPKVWAKRTNLFICGFTFAYAVKTYVLFSSCYNNYCPQKLAGLYLMIGSAVVLMVASFFPDVKLADKKTVNQG